MISVEIELSELENFGRSLPVVKVEPPGPRSREVVKTLGQFESPTMSHIYSGDIPISWRRARGANVEDVDGNIYIDMTAGFAVAVAGHCHPKVVEAVKRQLDLLTFTPGFMSPNEARAELTSRIAGVVPRPLKRTHFMSTGSEAMETAYKLARQSTGAHEVIAFEGGFHGMLFGALALTSRRKYRKSFLPVGGGVIHVPFPYEYRWSLGDPENCGEFCLHYLDHVLADPASGATDVAAVFTETVQAHEGWIVPPKGFLGEVRKICDEHNVLLVLDEIVTGFGRTGKMFYFEHDGFIPDIIACGKGMASGFPVSAVITTDKITDAIGEGQGAYGSTFQGNPIGCVAALSTLDIIKEEGLVERAAQLGNHFMNTMKDLLRDCQIVGDIRGIGMLLGIELVKDRRTKKPATEEATKVVQRATKKGLILQPPGGRFGNVLKLSPPVVITKEQLDEGIEVLSDTIKQI
jgi:4-aminobutyrate aminotransferase